MGTDVVESADALRASANRLYWRSEHTVDALAARLGMSRHALYACIRPAETGVACGDCGGALAWANRSARAAGDARCQTCGAVATVAAAEAESPAAEPPPAPLARRRRAPLTPRAIRAWARAAAAAGRKRVLMIGGAAALGVAAGLAAVDWFRDV